MKKALTDLSLLAAITTILVVLGQPSGGGGPDALPLPSPAEGREGRPAVLVNPRVQGHATAKTIQEGIAMVDSGGKVMVLPGTYEEALVIDKGLTLEAIGGESGPVIIAPPGTLTTAIQVATSDPVTIRDVTVQFTGVNGIRGDGVVDITVEQVRVLAVAPPLGPSFLVAVTNNAATTGGRARLAVRESFLDGTVRPESSSFPQVFGIRVQGDVDALPLEGNVIRRTGGACIAVFMRNDFGGETNAEILDNDLDECYPLLRAGSLIVIGVGTPPGPVTATGVVNIVGNTIRNTFESCLPTVAIRQSFAQGHIERNRILGVVQPCATPAPGTNPGAIAIGSLLPNLPAVSPIVRFNDIEGNAHAGLRVAPNITTQLNASCNWWGSPDGPSGAGPGSGDAIVVDALAPTPMFMPWATAPIAETDATNC